LVAAFWVSAAQAEVSYSSRAREHTLGNGLKLILLEEHKAPVGVIQVWYRVGSRHEQLGKTGLSHLLEHLMFKGTDKLGPEEYSRIIQRNGGNENAFTSTDSTVYFATLASDRLNIEIELEADRMQNLKFDDEQFIPEHQVVMEERRLRTEDSPIGALFELLNAAAYTAHPYGWPIIGWMNDLRQATREDALAYYKLHYVPNNAFLIAVGDFSAEKMIADIERVFGAVPRGDMPPGVRAVEPPQQGERRTVLRREAQLPFVAIAYHTPNLRHPDAPVLEVIAALLGSGKSSRLHERLVYEKRIARSAGSDYDYTSADPGTLVVYAQPMPNKPASLLEKDLLAELTRLQKAPVQERELEKAKSSLEAGFVLAQDSLFYQALLLGKYEIADSWQRIDEYLPRVRAVTSDDIQRVAQTYFTAENRTVATLDPLPVPSGKQLPPEQIPDSRMH
jgi:zinc protease